MNMNKIKRAVGMAELVLLIFEAKYPNDKIPRKNIKCAKKYLDTQTIGKFNALEQASDDMLDAYFGGNCIKETKEWLSIRAIHFACNAVISSNQEWVVLLGEKYAERQAIEAIDYAKTCLQLLIRSK